MFCQTNDFIAKILPNLIDGNKLHVLFCTYQYVYDYDGVVQTGKEDLKITVLSA